MTRDINSATETQSQSASPHPIWFVKLEFDSGNLNLHTRLGDITWGGDTYTGVGDIAGIGGLDEDSELTRSTLQLSLSGLSSEIIAIVLNEHYQGRKATIYMGYLDPDTQQLVANPAVIFRGRMDTAGIEESDSCMVSLTVESRFAAWDRPLVRRFNNADQQARYPGDKFFEFVEQSVEKNIVWGQANAN